MGTSQFAATSFSGLLGSDKEGMQNHTFILTLTSSNGLLGSDKQNRQNQKVILTLTSSNGLIVRVVRSKW